VTLAEALRSFAFWGSVMAAGIRNASYHAIGVHFVPLMVWKGLSQSEAALLLSVYAFLGMALTLILGWFADKANKPRLTAFILFAAAGAMFLPIAGDSLWSLCLFTIFFAAVETTFPLGWALVGDLFGRKHYAQIRGYMTMFYTWGGVIGPVVAGAIFDRWKTYEPLLWTSSLGYSSQVSTDPGSKRRVSSVRSAGIRVCSIRASASFHALKPDEFARVPRSKSKFISK
jgi:MFS family permease